MRFNRIRLVVTLMAIGAAVVLSDAERASAQTADLAGAWNLTVTTDTGVTNPSLTLEQDGETLTGHYSSEALGEEDVTGTITGSEFTISFTADLQGQMISVVYSGTIDEDGEMSGTINIGDGLLVGDFTAKRSDG